ncbi:MAG TPA: mechanosensitive ion channel protein MscS [Halieaceae bacterium]|nr:mechanosensitive ion channel protein MscS [Halieaceae bacterium]|tara:strand:+ start:925 stop:1986 length:1062 start_codon:yes stop_codon:yes gene_type:complete
MTEWLDAVIDLFPAGMVVALTAALIAAGYWLAQRKDRGTETLLFQLGVWLLGSAGIIACVVVLPISDETQGQILGLLGVLLTAVIALSSTTFVANAMAGVMLQTTRPFRAGDYLRVGEQFGRVTRRSLINTQLQTEMRDITTLPNMLLVATPITVMHRDGTIISAEVSLGYDTPYTEVQELLLQAAETSGLSDPFVLLLELLDHAVLYRVCGFLTESKTPLTARSNLRKKMLEQLHGHGIEIVSPSFVNQRRQDPATRVMPAVPVLQSGTVASEAAAPEERIFDKAEEAATLEELKEERSATQEALAAVMDRRDATDAEQTPALEQEIRQLEQREVWLKARIEEEEAPKDKAP